MASPHGDAAAASLSAELVECNDGTAPLDLLRREDATRDHSQARSWSRTILAASGILWSCLP